MIAERAATLATRDGSRLEARLAAPATATAGVVACHPHPLYGGDMHNPVVVRAVEVCAGLGFATLRFNFRGVGASTGVHDNGVGEEHDIVAALTALRDHLSASSPLALIGYSFGATVSANLAGRRQAALAGLALIAPPLAVVGEDPFLALRGFPAPLLIIAGTRDEYCPADRLEALSPRLPGAAVSVVDGANHFFFGKLFPLGEALAVWARGLQARQTRGGGGPG